MAAPVASIGAASSSSADIMATSRLSTRSISPCLDKGNASRFPGAGTFDAQVRKTITVTVGPEFGVNRTEHVYHTSFFEQEAVRQAMIEHLTA